MSDWRSRANVLNEFPSRMKNVSANNFGIAMAYLLQGLIALWGVGTYSETISGWLHEVPVNGPTIGGFLYLTLAALAAGMVASTVRWMLIDSIHHATGIRRPN